MKILKPKEVSQMLHVSVSTLQYWDNNDILKAQRTVTGRRYYYLNDIEIFKLKYFGEEYES